MGAAKIAHAAARWDGRLAEFTEAILHVTTHRTPKPKNSVSQCRNCFISTHLNPSLSCTQSDGLWTLPLFFLQQYPVVPLAICSRCSVVRWLNSWPKRAPCVLLRQAWCITSPPQMPSLRHPSPEEPNVSQEIRNGDPYSQKHQNRIQLWCFNQGWPTQVPPSTALPMLKPSQPWENIAALMQRITRRMQKAQL